MIGLGQAHALALGTQGELTLPFVGPLDLAPSVWLDATQLGLSDGASVAEFTDLSGNEYHFSQADPARRPVLMANGINGLPAVLSDGVDDQMKGAYDLDASGGFWAFLVARFPAISDSQHHTVISWHNTDAEPGNMMLLSNTKTLKWYGSELAESSGFLLAEDTDYGFYFRCWNGGERSFGCEAGSVTDANGVGRPPGKWMELFSALATYWPTNAYVGELIMGTNELTTRQETQVRSYLNTKWGVTIPA